MNEPIKQGEALSLSTASGITIPELDGAKIRVNDDGYFSVYDAIKVCGHPNPRQVWQGNGRKKKDGTLSAYGLIHKYPEVVQKTYNFQFPGRGQRKTPVVDIEGWLNILPLLPGAMGKKYRAEAAKLVLRYLNADPNLADEVIQRTDNPEDLKWIAKRAQGKVKRNTLTGVYKSHGVEGMGYADCTNSLYRGLFGADKKGLMQQRGLSTKGNFREHANLTEISSIDMVEDLTAKKIEKDDIHGNAPCAAITYDIANKLARFQEEILNA